MGRCVLVHVAHAAEQTFTKHVPVMKVGITAIAVKGFIKLLVFSFSEVLDHVRLQKKKKVWSFS